MKKETLQKNCTLPPWLWFWLVFYLFTFPIQVKYWKWYSRDLFSFLGPLPLANIPELLPSLALFFGIITISFPQIRSRWLEKKFNLVKIDSVSPDKLKSVKQVTSEIEDFLKIHAQNLQIKVNFNRFDQNAFLYASGYRKASIAIFAGFLRLWKLDRKAAESVLLHEIGHYRNGDALVIGAGSAFEWVLKNCFTIAALFFLVPTVLVLTTQGITSFYDSVYQEFTFLDVMIDAGMPSKEVIIHILNFSYSTIVFELKNLLIYLPILLFTTLWLFLWTINAFIPPIAGIWCAELNADRFMVEASVSPDAPEKALDRIYDEVPLVRWFLSQVSHPPKWFRKWMVNDINKSKSRLVLLLLFPLAYFLTIVELLIRNFIAYVPGLSAFDDIFDALAASIGAYLRTTSLVWLFSAVFILLWPTIAVYWVRFFSREVELSNQDNYKQYVLSAGIVFCFFLLGYFI